MFYSAFALRPLGSDSPKTLIERVKREIPDFVDHFAKFEEQVVIGGYSSSTLFNYSRAVSKISLYFKKPILDLDPDEVNEFLFALAKEKKASSTYLLMCPNIWVDIPIK